MSKPGLTKKQRRKLGNYLRDTADILNLRDWTFVVMHEPIPSDDSTVACIRTIYGQSHANIQFHTSFGDLTPEEQREIIVHELLHCYLPSNRNSWWGLDSLLGRPALTVIQVVYRDEMELAVDSIANAVAKLLPLPKI